MVNLQELALLYNNISNITPLTDLINIHYIGIQNNNISDISSLINLKNLLLLKIGGNNVTNINPLVLNQGIGDGDIINLVGNPLNETSIKTYIPQLQARGVIVVY